MNCYVKCQTFFVISYEETKYAGFLASDLGFSEDKSVLENLEKIKNHNKKVLTEYLKKTQDILIDETSIFDMQIKRLHEYKRQQMNILWVIDKYLFLR